MKSLDLTEVHKMRAITEDKSGVRSPFIFAPHHEEVRKVVLEVNSEKAAKLVLVYPDEFVRYLATVEGRARLTFMVPGTGAELWVEDGDGEFWWWTAEMEVMDVEVPDKVTFTVIRERRDRNPALDRMMKLASYNSQKRENLIMREVRKLQRQIISGQQVPADKNKLSAEQIAAAEQQAADDKAAADKKAADEKAAADKKKTEKA